MAFVYIVEDDKNIREIEVIALKNSGYEVQEFETAGEFRKAFEERQPDLLLLDLMLPDADGLDIVRELRQDKRGRELPIILVTARTTEIDNVKGLDIGADDKAFWYYGADLKGEGSSEKDKQRAEQQSA